MKFESVPVDESVGALAAHSLRTGAVAIRKGHLISADDVIQLAAAGVTSLVAARLEPGDVGEDEAARALADAVAGEGTRVEAPFTGRSNLFAATPGLLQLDVAAIGDVNGLDESITLATLPAYRPVRAGEMIATVKIIPYAVPETIVKAAVARAGRGRPLIRVAPYRLRRVGVVSTLTPGLKRSTIDKTLRVLGERLAPAGAAVTSAAETPHETTALTSELTRQMERAPDLIVVFGASAIADRRDVIPTAIEEAGGDVEHFGMPVDPGNLLLLGRIGDVPVIGAPGCARSPKENGFDWVLLRLLCAIPVTRADITALGVGGLLMEIVSRGQPRQSSG